MLVLHLQLVAAILETLQLLLGLLLFCLVLLDFPDTLGLHFKSLALLSHNTISAFFQLYSLLLQLFNIFLCEGSKHLVIDILSLENLFFLLYEAHGLVFLLAHALQLPLNHLH